MLTALSLSPHRVLTRRAVLTGRCPCCNRWWLSLIYACDAPANVTFHRRESVDEQIKVAVSQRMRKIILRNQAGKPLGGFQSNRGPSGKALLRGHHWAQVGVYERVLRAGGMAGAVALRSGDLPKTSKRWNQNSTAGISALNILTPGPSPHVGHRHNTVWGGKFPFLPSPSLPIHGWLGSILTLQLSSSGQEFDP